MSIVYPDEVTHRAIIKTIQQLIGKLSPVGVVSIPSVLLEKGAQLSVHESVEDQWRFLLKGSDMKVLIENNMEF